MKANCKIFTSGLSVWVATILEFVGNSLILLTCKMMPKGQLCKHLHPLNNEIQAKNENKGWVTIKCINKTNLDKERQLSPKALKQGQNLGNVPLGLCY